MIDSVAKLPSLYLEIKNEYVRLHFCAITRGFFPEGIRLLGSKDSFKPHVLSLLSAIVFAIRFRSLLLVAVGLFSLRSQFGGAC